MYDEIDEYDVESVHVPARTKQRERQKARGSGRETQGVTMPAARRGPSRAVREGRESFKCVHCRAFIGPTVSGGKHRNHCPLCLHSRHVDGKRPGDRASDCGAKMAPAGRFTRPNGEPMLLHRCLGCGFARSNRLAADDTMLLFEALPAVSPRRDEGLSTED